MPEIADDTLFQGYLTASRAGDAVQCARIVRDFQIADVDLKGLYELLFRRSQFQAVGELWEHQRTAENLTADIDRREKSENDVQASEVLTQSILNSVASHIVVLDRDGVICAVNAPWQRFALENGTEPGKSARRTEVGVNYLEICRESSGASSDGATKALDGIQAVLDGRMDSFSLEYPCHSPEQQRWFFMQTNPLGNGTSCAVITHTDITTRKLAEDELNRRFGGLEALVQKRTDDLQRAIGKIRDIQSAMDNVGISIQWIDIETGRLLYVNRCAAATLGYSIDEMLRLSVMDIAPNVDLAFLRQHVDNAALTGHRRFESVNRAKDGRLVPVDVIVYYPGGDAENPAYCIAFLNDITQLKAAEQALVRGNEAAEAADRANIVRSRTEAEARMQSRKLEAMGTMAAGIAHDFNNILGSIVGFAEMTNDDLPEESDARRNIAQILSAGFRARDLVARLLIFARQNPAHPVAVDIVVQVREAIELLRASLRPLIRLSFQGSIDEASATVVADPTLIMQIVMNLCINAADAMDNHGVIRISIDPARKIKGAPPEYRAGICLSVADTGCGMTPEVLRRMRDPFFTTKEPGKGSGLGLSVVYSIVTGLGGVIEVKSRTHGSNTGTEFHVFLPVQKNTLATGELRGTHTID